MTDMPNREPIAFAATADEASQRAWIEALALALPEETIVPLDALAPEARQRCRVAIVANPPAAELLSLPQLCWVQSVWAGVERLVAGLGQRPIGIARLIDPQLARTMAEAALAWTLYLHRDMPAYARQQQQRIWQPRPYRQPQQRTVGILGLGALGQAAAASLTQAGFTVCGWSRSTKSLDGIESFHGNDGLHTVLSRSEILLCLLPLTGDTRGLLDAAALARLPAGASLINFARGAIVDDAALCAALDSGHLEHAVLDVFDHEPLPEQAWQWGHPRVTVLPHCSAPTDRQSAAAIVAANIRRYRASGQLPECVDPLRGY